MPYRLQDAAARTELLIRLAQAGARIQRELSREQILQSACHALSDLGLRCSMAYPADGGIRVHAVQLGEQLATIEAVIGSPIVGPIRPMTPLVQRVWDEGAAYTGNWPEEVALFMRAPLAEVLASLGDGAFTRGIGVRVGDPDAAGFMIFATGAWLRDEDLGAFRLFAEQVAAAIVAARTVERLRERNAELAALNALAGVASGTQELEPMLAAAASVIQQAAGASAVGILMLEGARGEPRRVHATGRNPQLAEMLRNAPADDPVFRSVLSEGKVHVVHPETVPPRVGDAFVAAGIATVALVPLRFRGDPVGAVAVAFSDRRPAAACHVDLLGAMGGQLGGAIESHNLLEDLRRRVSELTLLNDIAADTVSLDPAALLENVLRGVCATLRADSAAAFFIREGHREFVARIGLAPTIDEAPPPSPDDLSESTMRLKRPLRWPEDVPETPRNRWFREREGMRRSICVPLLAKDRAIGCFMIGRHTDVPFSTVDLALLAAVGVQVGVAVDNARLYDDLRRSYAAIERAQERLIQQERFAALGQLSAVVAHEVRNPLGVIFNSLGPLRRIVQAGGEGRMLLDIVDEEANRLNRIVGDLLDFARPAPPALRREPLAPLIADAANAAGFGPAIRFESRVATDLPPVPMDPRLMRQALVNLFMNAAQAMPGGGLVSVDAHLEGDRVRVEIADTGRGVPEELRARIFEPFFTTRPTGTGLGLAVVKRIVDEHRATIQVEPVHPIGTRFVLRLSLSTDAAAQGTLSAHPSRE